MEFEFGKAGAGDIPELVRLRLEYLREDFGSLSEEEEGGLRERLPDYFRRRLGKELAAFIARAEGRIVSCALLLEVEKPPSPAFPGGLTGLVLNVYTEKAFRGRGAARRLMKSLLSEAKEKGLDFVELKATDAGYPLYKSLGFADVLSSYRNMKYPLQGE